MTPTNAAIAIVAACASIAMAHNQGNPRWICAIYGVAVFGLCVCLGLRLRRGP